MTIYQDIILEHYRNPRNKGTLPHPSQSADANNPVCGDSLHVDIVMKDDVLEEIAFQGNGCAISQAYASVLFEYVKGKTKDDILAIDTNTMLQLIELELSPVRLKCALLSLEVLKKAVMSSSQNTK